ncbi:hypothetical protein BJ944DRAFT_244370 [Cunninghamella echinulata]|nr:hypothetical protein BJ944DRAFT_244370 [Cunninghamella echinulata]
MSEEIEEVYNEAYNSTQLWIKQHQKQYQNHLSIIISDEEKGFVPFENHENRLFHYSTENTYIILCFDKSINYSMNVDELQKSINYIAFNRLPLPNFIIPNRWNIYPQTLTSAIRGDGIGVLSFENGKIKIHVKADFFYICGNLKDTPFICGLTPKGAHFPDEADGA